MADRFKSDDEEVVVTKLQIHNSLDVPVRVNMVLSQHEIAPQQTVLLSDADLSRFDQSPISVKRHDGKWLDLQFGSRLHRVVRDAGYRSVHLHHGPYRTPYGVVVRPHRNGEFEMEVVETHKRHPDDLTTRKSRQLSAPVSTTRALVQ